MSGSDDLTTAFGAPARALSARLPPRRRRETRSGEPAAGGRGDVAENGQELDGSALTDDRAGLGAVPASVDELGQGGLSVVPAQPGSDPELTTSDDRPRGSRQVRSTTTKRSRPDRAGAPAASSSAEENLSHQTAVYVHPRVKTIATAQRREQKVSNAEIAFDAIDAVQHRLAKLIRTRRLQNRPESSLFPGRLRRGPISGGGAAAAAGETRRVLWGFRATDQELAVIDRLVELTGAESRSELVATALEEVLLQSQG